MTAPITAALAEHSLSLAVPSDVPGMSQALQIRLVEDRLLELFAAGALHGTVHTSTGQEYCAVAFAGQLAESDVVWSGHRCHGHYLALTGDVRGLVAELMGRSSGICGGIGGSQHLCRGGFHSSGVQGGTVPVAAGMALASRFLPAAEPQGIGVVFIGDGTLGEGAVYETLNLISKWSIPLLVVCEDNGYAQTTPRDAALAGDILARATAFGIRTAASNTWDPQGLMAAARESIDYVREHRRPFFHLVSTYRLNPHSARDDLRDPAEVARMRACDPIERFRAQHPQEHRALLEVLAPQVSAHVEAALADEPLPVSAYLPPRGESRPARPASGPSWVEHSIIPVRQAELLNRSLRAAMAADPTIVLLGEDIVDPYGGAFKVTRGLSGLYPDRVLSTPISEAAITGLATGMALAGLRPIVEIMFGDFITLAMDQLVNHAAKFAHMYNGQRACPLILRTPMGGGRGYGPTHSQTLDRLVMGIHDTTVAATNVFLDPGLVLRAALAETHPVVIIENKSDYAQMVAGPSIPNYVVTHSQDPYPWVRIRPRSTPPDTTVVAYGGIARLAAEAQPRIFAEHERLVELLIPTRIHPADWTPVINSVAATGRLIVVEEGPAEFGFGGEVIARVCEALPRSVAVARVGAANLPIPSAAHLEAAVLPGVADIVRVVGACGSGAAR